MHEHRQTPAPGRADHRFPAFTLIELLVVVAIISVLMTILLPALAGARRQAKATVGLANLRSCTQVMFVYTNDHKEEFLNPFRPGQPTVGGSWTDAVQIGDGSGMRWDFSSAFPEWNTEFFAYYWYSYLAEWRGEARVDEAMISPADSDLMGQFRQMRGYAETRDKRMLWPSSFIYSPTFWSDSDRYQRGSRGALLEPSLKTAAAGSVSSPSAKVLMFERADFAQNKRVEIGQAGSTSSGNSPAWNNPRSRTSIGMADGSVDQVSMADLTRKAGTLEGGVYLPGGSFRAPDGLPLVASRADVGRYPVGGSPATSDAEYPLFFWATNGGVKGRDIPR
ncbi:MAG: type II secretion system protein [Phycisphaerales bacterium]|nr:type II secretion system protein [Phycisphaerales bacterium]